MTEFEEKVIEKLSNLEKQNTSIMEILSKSLDMALNTDTFNVDNFSDLFQKG